MLAYHKVNNINAKVGIYLRISLEDGDKVESNSIENQRKLIYEYLKKNNFVNIMEFVDDGATGTNFNRKGFKSLLENIENKNINTVITKDVSRIGRNYVKTGYYIEDYFVSKGVRYISILDDIDTYLELIGNELLPFRAILNEMYSKDISLKQKSSLIERKKRGRYIACYAPYGYKKNEDIKGKLDIDEEAAKVVRRTFELFLSGMGTSGIAKLYTEEKIPTPAMYMNMNSNKDSMLYSIWKPVTIKHFLRNETYLGHMIQNKEKTVSYKDSKRVYLDKEDYIVIHNHHKPIISKEDFEKANQILDSKRKYNNHTYNKTLLHDFLYCKECNKKLARKIDRNKNYYFCITRTVYHICDNSNYLSYDEIENEVFKYIIEILKKYSNKEILGQAYMEEYKKNKTKIDEYKKEYSQISNDLLKVNHKLDMIYSDKLNNVITADTYKKYSVSLKKEQKEIEKKIERINFSIDYEEKNIRDLKNDTKKMEDTINQFQNLENIDSNVIKELVEKIFIGKDRKIYVKLRYNF